MLAKVQAMFDKADVEKQHTLNTNNIEKGSEAAVQKNADAIKAALLDQINTGKVGSLTVDPQFLDFEALECKLIAEKLNLKLPLTYVLHPQLRVPTI